MGIKPTTSHLRFLIAQLVEHHTGDVRLWIRFLALKSWDFFPEKNLRA